MNALKIFVPLTVSIVLTSTALSDEAVKSKKKSKMPGFVTKLIDDLQPVGLTEQQSKSITTLGQETNAEIAKTRKDANVTPDLAKKYNEAAKSMKDSTESAEAKAAAINEKAGVTAEQGAAIRKMADLKSGYFLKVGALLTDEQKGKLPKQVARKLIEKKKGKGKGKKKGELQEAL